MARCIGRGNCSAVKWPLAVKRLRDGLSFSLFAMLPSRFALVAGACAREHVRKFLDSSSAAQRHSLSVPINPTAGLNVEFSDGNNHIIIISHAIAIIT